MYARITKDEASASWLLTCDVCGLVEHWHRFWIASRALDAHRAMHEEEEAAGQSSPKA